MTEQDKVLEKIRKLLALSQSNSEAEAASAHEKAHALLRKYNLTLEDIKIAPEIKPHKVKSGGREIRWKTELLDAVAKANYCQLIITKGGGAYEYKLYGREHNVKGAMVLYEYLIEAIDRLTDRAAKQNRRLSRYDFRLGMAYGISDRLRAATIQENTECTAIVQLASEAKKAADEDCHPETRKATEIKPNHSMVKGYMAAEEVGLDQQVSARGHAESITA